MNKTQLTQHGYQQLEKELSELRNVKRPLAVDRLQKARGMGDLSENSEYIAAKENLAFIDERISEIEEMLKNAQVVINDNQTDKVELGSLVTVKNDNGNHQFTIVGEYEADPANQKLSASSPIGKALLGKKINEEVEVEVPAGKIKYKIIEIK